MTSPRSARRAPALSLALTLCASLLLGAACGEQHQAASLPGAGLTGSAAHGSPDLPHPSLDEPSMVSLRVFDAAGQLVGPVSLPKLELSDDEWRERLSEEQFRILRSSGTERPFCGALLDNKVEGVYTCAGCGLPLFSSASKFKSGTGWPSFFQPIAAENVAERTDSSHGMIRKEINCARCDGHLGHVFDDGPRPTGLRFCLNSESLGFTPLTAAASLADPGIEGTGDEARAKPVAAAASDAAAEGASAPGAASATGGKDASRAEAVFAGGCFWCVEAVFEELAGVHEVISGYAGGTAETANYEAVCSGTTDHAEAVQILYDPAVIGFADLLEVHFATHDPTTLNRQGNDVGPQYRSTIFYANEQEQQLAAAFIEDLDDSGVFGDEVVTTLEPLVEFFPAEPYHQNYVCNNPAQGYVRGVALPKVQKVRAKFADRLKERSPLER